VNAARAYSIPTWAVATSVPDLSPFHQLAEFGQGGLTQARTSASGLPVPALASAVAGFLLTSTRARPPTPLAMTQGHFPRSAGVRRATTSRKLPVGYPLAGPRQSALVANRRRLGFGGSASGTRQFIRLRDVVDEAMSRISASSFKPGQQPTAGRVQILQERFSRLPSAPSGPVLLHRGESSRGLTCRHRHTVLGGSDETMGPMNIRDGVVMGCSIC